MERVQRTAQVRYESLKQEYPDLPIFATFTVSHMSGLDGGDQTNPKSGDQIASVLSRLNRPAQRIPTAGCTRAGRLTRFPKISLPPRSLLGSRWQSPSGRADRIIFLPLAKIMSSPRKSGARWVDFLLRQAEKHQFKFVVGFTGIDYEKLLEVFPKDVRELGMIWVYTGLERSDGCANAAGGLG